MKPTFRVTGKVAANTILNKTSFDAYTRTCCVADPLTREEEREAFAAIANGDTKARDSIVLANQRMLVSLAGYYAKVNNYSVQDLISAGNIGLLKAISRFDPKRGLKFMTYAVWYARREIQIEALAMRKVVHTPVNGMQHLKRIQAACDKLDPSGMMHASLPAKLIAETAGVPLPAAEAFIVSINADESLDRPLSEHTTSNDSALDMLPAKSDTAQEACDASARELVQRMLSDLAPYKAEMLSLRFGIDGGESRTLHQVGEIVNKTRERVRQACDECMEEVRTRPRFKYARNDRGGY